MESSHAGGPGSVAAVPPPLEAPPPPAPRRASRDDLAALVQRIRCFVLDCDGVLWRGDAVIPGVPETLAALRAAGKQVGRRSRVLGGSGAQRPWLRAAGCQQADGARLRCRLGG